MGRGVRATVNGLAPAHLALIDALADLAVEDYLTAQAAERQGSNAEPAERPLLPLDEAA